MAKKRKISVRKILQVMLTAVVSLGCIIAMVSASKIEDNKTLASVAIHISNDKKYHFIEEKEIRDLAIDNRHIDIEHTPLSRLDIHAMEQVILADPWVAAAEVFIDNDRVLHMYVTQRIPVARVFQQNNASYYLDTTLSIMPLSGNYVYYSSVVTNVPEIKNDSAGWALRKQIVSMVRCIQADTFWSAQVSQIIVDSDATFELVPVLGNQRILFGNASGMREKFDNLFLFYKNVLNRIGWDKYETLDVRFKGQVIASPSLPYKGPVDKAVDKMNWITSIVETEAVSDAKDSVHTAEVKAAQVNAAKAAAAKQALNAKDKKKVTPKKQDKKSKAKAQVKSKAKKEVKKDAKKKPAKEIKKQQAKSVKTAKTNQEDKKTAAPKYVYPEKK